MKRNRLLHNQTDSDPMGTVANLFDVAMVFAVALMVALVSRFNMTEMFSKEDFTMVKRIWKSLRKKDRKSSDTLPARNRKLPASEGKKSV